MLFRARSHNDTFVIRYVHPVIATGRVSANAQSASVAHTDADSQIRFRAFGGYDRRDLRVHGKAAGVVARCSQRQLRAAAEPCISCHQTDIGGDLDALCLRRAMGRIESRREGNCLNSTPG